MYRTLADVEAQTQLADLYIRLAETEERHASFWEDKLRAAGETVQPRPSRRIAAPVERVFDGWAALERSPEHQKPTIERTDQRSRRGHRPPRIRHVDPRWHLHRLPRRGWGNRDIGHFSIWVPAVAMSMLRRHPVASKSRPSGT